MKKRTVGAAAAVALVAVVSAATAQQVLQAPPQPQFFVPGMDDLMTMLIQPRHIRLYYAGKAENWQLAAAEARNLRSSFDKVAAVMPTYLGNDVAQAVTGFLVPGLDAMDAAVAVADPAAFDTAYQQITDGCNACHFYTERSYLVIKVPSGDVDTAHPDQDYSTQP